MTLREAFAQRILLLDGAMGSLLMKGNNDQLSLTEPDRILDIHRRYIAAGADVITTNTFSSQRISQHEYHLEDQVKELNRASVRLARQAASEVKDRQIYVLGDVGPTSKMLSMSEDVNDPAARSITFDELEAAYLEQIQTLVDEGVDGILIETIFDTLNAKAAISACLKAGAPEILLSMTVSDASGRTLSGQTVEAFVTSVLHAHPLCLGLNCGLGAAGLLPYLRRMSACAPCYVSCHPNAGLPNQFGGYDDTPEKMAQEMQPYLSENLVNMIGGCCGTTPEHIATFRKLLDANENDRRIPQKRSSILHLSGLELLSAPSLKGRAGGESSFLVVGERCNVAGSRKFLKLISEKQYDSALDIARKQVEDGAKIIDINMDDGLLDANQEMQTFLNLLASDPFISRVPIMVDSSRFDVIEAGLKCCQGKCIVNSISLKLGEEEFLNHARIVKRLGAAVIAMCFDEEGQATDYQHRIRICQRMYRLLTEEVGFVPSDIIFDPNVLTIATGMAEHADYAQDFIRATRWVNENLPGTRVSGGLSNLSFAFRGNNYLREAMHSVFLHFAIPNGMGMAIMNPATAIDYKTIPLELRMAITEVILNTSQEATEELIEIAQKMSEAQVYAKEAGLKYDPKAIFSHTQTDSAPIASVPALESKQEDVSTPEARLQVALLKGISTTLDADLKILIDRGESPLDIISGPLMTGMNEVGRLFGEGKMFLPQVVKTARTMKRAVEYLNPFIQGEKTVSASRGRIVIATVKGDVHDIGKNIVGVILSCNGFEVIDLGVMIPCEKIIETAIEQQADIICLSGLITPSLEEMCVVARALQQRGLKIPLMVGGATTSAVHTAVKIAPCYDGPVFHVRDAASNPGLAMRLLDPMQREQVIAENQAEQVRIRLQQSQHQQKEQMQQQTSRALGSPSPLERRLQIDWNGTPQPPFLGSRVLPAIPVCELIPLIDWLYFYWAWRVKEDSDEGRKLRADADQLLQQLADDSNYDVRVAQAFYRAEGLADRIRVFDANDVLVEIPTPRQQKQTGTCLSLCDYIRPNGDFIGAFACAVSLHFIDRLEKMKAESGGSDYEALLLQTVGDRLVEAAAEYLSRKLMQDYQWGGIRPAVGYPSLPDQKTIFLLDKMIDFGAIGITLTENGAMYPQASVSGLYIAYPEAEYFDAK